ncbi:Calx-beta domain-containing protein [Roseobacter sp.]|uniref:Calx-beta domain-containing protein n=1 Tax=Roseobacter sp. TaxID=1907202 RepID=UPI0029662B05|nr:Calx-beta domain-containing protein [Roseobacter sp.]MDW3181513.1 Calx-beta domain-containing protein [Roseobacter sp.]
MSRPNIVEGDAGEKNAIFEISFSRPIPEAITLSYETVDGGAEAGSDYTAVSGTIDLVAGQTVAAVSVPVLGDTDVEFSESFTLAVSTTSTAVAEIAQGQATILDDDAGGAQPTVSIAPAASNESFDTFDSNALIFAATLSEAATEEVTVFYRLLSGTGTAGAEGDAYPGPGPRSPVSEASVTFAPGETSKTIPIWTAGNASGSEPAELDEAVVLQAFSVQGAAFAGGGSTLEATGWILDIDGSENPLAGFVSRPNIVEGDAGEKNAIFEISFSRPIPEAITLSYETVDGGAEAGSDYTAVSGTIDLVAGQTVAAVSVPVLGDTDVEFSESFTLAVSTTSTAVAEIAQGQATILDDDAGGAQPTVSIAPAASNESFDTFDSNALIFAATLSEAATEEVTVFYRLLSGTGTAGAEGDAYPGPGPRSPVSEASVTFAPGETSKTIPIWTAGNASGSEPAELDEAVVLQAFSVQGAAFAGGGSTLEATGWILDIDGSENPLAGFVSRPNIVEGDAGEKNAIFEISFSRPIPEAITLSYETVDGGAEAGSDYTAVSGTIDLVAGQTVAAVSVPVLGDTDVEFSESFTLAVSTTSTAVAEIAQGQATILDDDAGGAQPTVSIAPAASNESFDTFDSNALIFAATLSEAATEEVTVFYRLLSGTGTAGAEGDAYPGPGPRSPVSEASVTFAPGETSKTIPIWTAGNASGSEPAELDEAVVLQAFSVQGAAFAGGGSTLEATGWILDIDGSENPLAGFVSRPNIVEGDAGEKNAIFEISFSRPIPEAITLSYETVDGGAEAGSDYTAVSGTIDLVAGQTVAAVSVPVLGDTDVEFSESFTLAVSTTSTAVAEIAQGQATILDDDAIELLGREGSDVFVFTSGDRSGVSTDAINGLEVGIDRVVLDEFGLSSHRLQFDNRAGDLTLELATERFFELRGYATESEFGNLEDAFDFI